MAITSANGILVGLLTPSEAAEYLACSERQLRNYVASGLPSVREGNGHRRFRAEDLRAWVDRRVGLESASTPNTATSTSSASRPSDSATKGQRVSETAKRLRMKLTGSTPRRSKGSGHNDGQANVLPLRRT